MNKKAMFSSETDLWSTPKDFFLTINKEFNFGLDVCADDQNHKCLDYFTKEQNGLSKNWADYANNKACWMNPPYGREISKWIKKAYESNCLVVGLLPARTDTRWFHDYVLNKAEIRFIKGRLKFGESDNSAPFPSMLVIWRIYND